MADLENRLFELWMDEKLRDVQSVVNPSAGARYTDPTELPSRRVDTLFRHMKEFRWKGSAAGRAWISPDYAELPGQVGWIDMDELEGVTARYVPELDRVGFPYEVRGVFDVVGDRIAHVKYQDEWKSVKELGDIAVIINEQPAARVANETHCTKVTPHLIERLQRGGAVLMDLGCGGGGSSYRVIEAVPSELRSRLTYLAVDVMQDGVDVCRERFTPMGVKVVPVTTIAADMHDKPQIRAYKGKVDAFVSGACIHQNTNFDTVYSAVHELMAPRGQLRFWDWCHLAWSAPVLRAGYNLVETTEGLPGRGVEGAREMCKVWVGLHGYGLSPQEKDRGEALGRYQKKLLADFERGIRGEGFDFTGWLQANLDGQEPTSKVTPYRRAEAHPDPEVYRHYLDRYFGRGATKIEPVPGTPLLFAFSVDKAALRT